MIGMPGSGKSTIGVILAKRLGYSFVDTDLIIQEQEKRLLKEIIADVGNDEFMEIENRVIAHLEADRCVIAPGGSVVYEKDAMDHLSEISTIVYLKVSCEDLEKRLGNLKERGVILREGMTFSDLYDERIPLCEKYADITIDEENMTPQETVDALRAVLEKNIVPWEG